MANKKNRFEYINRTNGGKYPDGAQAFFSNFDEEDGEWLAEEAAEDDWNDSDHDPDCWPQTFEIFSEGRSLGVYEVYLDFSPDFSASKL